MTPIRWLWRQLVRPRGHVSHRFYRGGRGSRGGVALLMAIASILLLTILVSEISRGAVVRVQLAGQHRDEAKAVALADSGLQFYRLVLMASRVLGNNPSVQMLGQFMGVNANELWQALPFVDTRFMRLLFVTGGDADEAAETRQTGGLTDDQIDESREATSLLSRNFLDFDGDFHASVVDSERRIFVGRFQATNLGELLQESNARQLLSMMKVEEHRDFFRDIDYEPEELIANLADWTDADDTRMYQGGSEDALYERLEPPYRAKNMPFDTRAELRLVDGWHLDGVWERFGKHITVYGSGKVNVNTAVEDVMRGLLLTWAENASSEAAVEPALRELMSRRGTPMSEGGLTFTTVQAFLQTMDNLGLPLRSEAAQALTTKSSVFQVRSSAEVGSARAEALMMIDFSRSHTGSVLYWRMR